MCPFFFNNFCFFLFSFFKTIFTISRKSVYNHTNTTTFCGNIRGTLQCTGDTIIYSIHVCTHKYVFLSCTFFFKLICCSMQYVFRSLMTSNFQGFGDEYSGRQHDTPSSYNYVYPVRVPNFTTEKIFGELKR